MGAELQVREVNGRGKFQARRDWAAASSSEPCTPTKTRPASMNCPKQTPRHLTPRCYRSSRGRMLVGCCLLCLVYFPPAAGQAEWLRGGLAPLTQGDGTLCHWVAGDGSAASWSFLARLRGGLVLFQTLWSGAGELERCTVREELRITRAYLAFCLETRDGPGLADGVPGPAEPRLRLLQRLATARCRPSSALPAVPRRGKRSSPATAWLPRERASVARRRRRGWTVPGTIWCGAGDSAENFSDLGIFKQTDFCCREHDHCEHKIYAFEYKYGMLNFRLHTISHCDCDYRFKKCLLDVNNTISTLVEVTFFSILQVPCFTLEPVEHCMGKTWLSRCQVTELTHQAILRPQSKYNYIQPNVDDEMGPWTAPTESPATTSRVNKAASSVSAGFSYPASQRNVTQKAQGKNKKKCRKCSGHQKQETEAPSQNILKSRTDLLPTAEPGGVDFNHAIEQNSMENSFLGGLLEKRVSTKLLQKNASSLMSHMSGIKPVGLDESVHKRHNFSLLTELSTVASFSRSSESLPSYTVNGRTLPTDPTCLSGSWNHLGVAGNCSSDSQSRFPIQYHWTQKKGSSRICNCYKPLDRCEHKILPQEFKFSHYNQEPKTLYHCACTRRLARRMKRGANVKAVKDLFFEFVSLNCFQLKLVPKNCSKEGRVLCENQSGSTVAILSKPKYLKKVLKVRRTAEESLFPSPDEQERNENGTFNSTNSVKLYDKCLQMIRALTVKF